MMKQMLTLVAVMALMTASPAMAKKTDETVETCEVPTDSTYWSPAYPVINLTEDNHVVMRGPIDSGMASRIIHELHTKGTDDEVYLYISSPGGSVVDGYHIVQAIDALHHSGKTVKAIADTAISMAFVIFQSCPVRYARPSSILMQHQMSFGIRGPIEHVKSYVDFVNGMENDMLVRQAERIGLTPEEFKEKTLSDWWTYGSEITANNLADEMVYILCGPNEFDRTTSITVETFFGDVTVHYSGCPLLNKPQRVEFSDDMTEEEMKLANELMVSYLDPGLFRENYQYLRQMIPSIREMQ